MTAVEKSGCWRESKRYGKAQKPLFSVLSFLPIFGSICFFPLETLKFSSFLYYLSIFLWIFLIFFILPSLPCVFLLSPHFKIFFFPLSIFTFFGEGDLATPGWSFLDWTPSRIEGEIYQSCLLDLAIKIEREISEDSSKPFLYCCHENYRDVSVTPNWRINDFYLNLRVLLLLEVAELQF